MADLRINYLVDEAAPAELSESEHVSNVERKGSRRRGACACGWSGRWRSGRAATWNAAIDADEHHNENVDVRRPEDGDW